MSRPITRAKNASQHPGQVVLDAQPKPHNNEMTALAIRRALSAVEKEEDKQAREDLAAENPVPPPSQRQRAQPKMASKTSGPGIAPRHQKSNHMFNAEAAKLLIFLPVRKALQRLIAETLMMGLSLIWLIQVIVQSMRVGAWVLLQEEELVSILKLMRGPERTLKKAMRKSGQRRRKR
ncbi:hypothetical protein SERLA73DRAFT_140090 [Serpula lacrymans var. lacrymans S7.3]|uniref:Uncharacterized protein n=1 Tax=Serpula lacrymans var. lacrymans (strain S7.3) TaxID=936435 RepID=F8Q3H2_SERL3|nr:hypothetical protein SERLA73DRAFT_140090 [Serpula lacrymans var. lacrymans S7.3]